MDRLRRVIGVLLICVAAAVLPAVCSGCGGPAAEKGSGGAAKPMPSVQKLLTAADVEKATGVSGVRIVTGKDSGTTDGEGISSVMFSDKDGMTMLHVAVYSTDVNHYEDTEGYYKDRTDVAGLGDKAFTGTRTQDPTIQGLCAGKGDKVIVAETFRQSVVESDGTERMSDPLLTLEQMKGVLGVLLSRL